MRRKASIVAVAGRGRRPLVSAGVHIEAIAPVRLVDSTERSPGACVVSQLPCGSPIQFPAGLSRQIRFLPWFNSKYNDERKGSLSPVPNRVWVGGWIPHALKFARVRRVISGVAVPNSAFHPQRRGNARAHKYKNAHAQLGW